MLIAGIVSEYNPFHAGHLYHINETKKKTGADYIVACMSGAFTQRGLFAFMDKFDRVRMALAAGVDAVVELPAVCAVRPAQWFARGGVSVLSGIGADVISFGSENADEESIYRLFSILQDEPEELKNAIKQGLSEGKTLARARGEALNDLFPGLSDMPNLALGLEYMSSVKALNSDMKICVIKRNSPYHSENLTDGLSASEIRRAVSSGDADWAREKLPESTRPVFESALSGGISNPEKVDSLVLHALRSLSPEILLNLPDAGEGLAERLFSKAQDAASVEEVISLVKCKRYTRARITRVIAGALLSLPHKAPEEAPYLRLLGFRRESSPLIKEMNIRSGG
ncbi:MAG: nucleotidyltransferase family protein, partial [Clostridia bacterium]|nr:nucleotidyltransferase family protein [Clostridia bacterium]